MAKGLTDEQKQTAADMIFAEWERHKSDYDAEEITELFISLDFHEYANEVAKWAEPADQGFEFLPSKD